MSSDASRSPLRLVGPEDPQALAAWRAEQHARARVLLENRAAALAPDLEPTDPRWVLAVRAQSQLQGTLLTPENRCRVQETARVLGIRPHEANMIMAIVQDHARRGLMLGDAVPSLKLLRRPSTSGGSLSFLRLAAATAAALMATALAIRWLVS